MREKRQIANSRNKKGNITRDSSGNKRIKREYYEQLYANKYDKSDKRDKFPERHKPSKYTHEKLDTLNETALYLLKKLKAVKNLPTKITHQGQFASLGNTTKYLKKEIPILHKLFQKIAK